MGWDKEHKYYRQCHREDGRVVCEYIGSGKVAEVAAQLAEMARETDHNVRQAKRAARAAIEAQDATVEELDEFAELLVRAALVAAGYHQHHRRR